MAGEGRLARWFIEHYLAKQRFDEAVVVMFSMLVVVFVAPAALIRGLTGNWLQAGVDSLAVLVALGNGRYVWRTGRTEVAAPVTAALILGTMVAAVHLFGIEMVFWAFPATAATFFLLRPSRAAIVNLVVLAAIAPRVLDLPSHSMVVAFFATVLAVNVLGLVFSASVHFSRSGLRTMVERDALTGAHSRHMLEPALLAVLEQHQVHGLPASLLVIDLDHFKQVNDTHGHDIGDSVLVEVTQRIDRSIRAGDLLFRYGGEELVVLAHGAPAEGAGRMAEKLREGIRRAPIGSVGFVSASIGVAEAWADDTPESWFHRADESLYQAKHAGRNCVRVAGAPPAAGPAAAQPPA